MGRIVYLWDVSLGDLRIEEDLCTNLNDYFLNGRTSSYSL